MPQVKMKRHVFIPGKEFKIGETYDVTDEEYEALKRAEGVEDEPEAPKKKHKSD